MESCFCFYNGLRDLSSPQYRAVICRKGASPRHSWGLSSHNATRSGWMDDPQQYTHIQAAAVGCNLHQVQNKALNLDTRTEGVLSSLFQDVHKVDSSFKVEFEFMRKEVTQWLCSVQRALTVSQKSPNDHGHYIYLNVYFRLMIVKSTQMDNLVADMTSMLIFINVSSTGDFKILHFFKIKNFFTYSA